MQDARRAPLESAAAQEGYEVFAEARDDADATNELWQPKSGNKTR